MTAGDVESGAPFTDLDTARKSSRGALMQFFGLGVIAGGLGSVFFKSVSLSSATGGEFTESAVADVEHGGHKAHCHDSIVRGSQAHCAKLGNKREEFISLFLTNSGG